MPDMGHGCPETREGNARMQETTSDQGANDPSDGGRTARRAELWRIVVSADPKLARRIIELSGLGTLDGNSDRTLLDTLGTFLDTGGNIQLTARRIPAHRRTVSRRIDRLEEISGLDLGCGSDRLIAALALVAINNTGPTRHE